MEDNKFGFRKQHSTVDQIHTIIDLTKKVYKGEVCSVLFLDVASTFDKVWEDKLVNKLK